MNDSVKIAVDALQAKIRELLEDRDATRRKVLEEAYRNVQIERDIAGCVAGARALGFEIDDPNSVSSPMPKQNFIQQFKGLCMQVANLYPQLKAEFNIEDDGVDAPGIDDSQPEMPRIADIIFERLQVAGEEGAKAADIRRYIYRTYSTDIHEKTVGMTLNRMQAAGRVRRDGRTWFLASLPALATAEAPKSNDGRT